MNLIIQGPDVETGALKELAKLSGASGIVQIAPNVFRLSNASPADGVAELCARQNLEWAFVPEEASAGQAIFPGGKDGHAPPDPEES